MAEASRNPGTLADLLLSGKTDKSRPTSPPRPDPRPSQGQLDLLFSAGISPEPPHPSPPLTPSESRTNIPIAHPAPPTPARDTRHIWSVAALVTDVRQHLELGYHDVLVTGEISNCRPASSGHIYFTLRDGDAQLTAVLFRRQAQFLRFPLRDGLEVLARGRISMFEQRGQLQLIAETLEPRGTGSLQLAFEQLKARLLAEGLFDSARKRPLPAFPQRVGVVTSTGGAVIHDIIKVIRRRHACLDLLIFPAAVQGPECAATVAAGVRWFNRAAGSNPAGGAGPNPFGVDLIVIARGGGSLEDLAGFNDEALARTLAASKLPVVSAVGHETDFTIADFVADLRAPTPSAAAEIITAAQHRIEERVSSLDGRLHRAIRYQTIMARQRLTALSADQILSRVHDSLARRAQRVDHLERRLDSAIHRRLQAPAVRLTSLSHGLERLHPGETLRSYRERLELANNELAQLFRSRIAPAATRLERAEARLHALSPLSVLSRGYALVYNEDGTLLRDSTETRPGAAISARLAQGSISAQVTRVDNKHTSHPNGQ